MNASNDRSRASVADIQRDARLYRNLLCFLYGRVPCASCQEAGNNPGGLAAMPVPREEQLPVPPFRVVLGRSSSGFVSLGANGQFACIPFNGKTSMYFKRDAAIAALVALDPLARITFSPDMSAAHEHAN